MSLHALSRTISVLVLLSSCAVLAEDAAPKATPQPRKRLQRETATIDHSTTKGQVTVGVIQTPEARFLMTTADVIQRSFNQLRQSHDGEIPGTKVRAVLRVDSQSKSAEVESIHSDMTDKMKALFRSAVAQCNGSIDVPKELVEKRGRYIVCELNFEFLPPGAAGK